jgi:hypothetical protein
MCFVWIWEQTAIISLYSIKWLVCITETECVYCAVRTGSLNIILVLGWHRKPNIYNSYFLLTDSSVCLSVPCTASYRLQYLLLPFLHVTWRRVHTFHTIWLSRHAQHSYCCAVKCQRMAVYELFSPQRRHGTKTLSLLTVQTLSQFSPSKTPELASSCHPVTLSTKSQRLYAYTSSESRGQSNDTPLQHSDILLNSNICSVST